MAAKAMPSLIAQRQESAPFWPSLCQVLGRLGGERISPSDFDPSKIDPHLRIRLAVVDAQGDIQQASREVQALQPTKLSSATPIPVAATELPEWFSAKWIDFAVDTLPRRLTLTHQGVRIERYVALMDRGEFASAVLFDYEAQANAAMVVGLTRLFALADNRELKSHLQHLPGLSDAQLRLSDRLSSATLRDGLRDLLTRLAFVEDREIRKPPKLVWSKTEFADQRRDRIARIAMAASDISVWLPKLSLAYHQVRLLLPKTAPAWQANLHDVQQQLSVLFRPEFLRYTPWEWLREYPRYLDAIKHRIARWTSGGVQNDATQMRIVNDYEKALTKLTTALPHQTWLPPSATSNTPSEPWPLDALANFRWAIEELRVSLFAQQLGTRIPVSSKRLDKLRDACQ